MRETSLGYTWDLNCSHRFTLSKDVRPLEQAVKAVAYSQQAVMILRTSPLTQAQQTEARPEFKTAVFIANPILIGGMRVGNIYLTLICRVSEVVKIQ